MTRERKTHLATVAVLILALGAALGQKTGWRFGVSGSNPPSSPQDAIYGMLDAARSGNVSAYLALGKSCLMTNDLNLTLQAAKKVLRTEPNNVQAMILEALVQQKQKKWSDSLTTLSTAKGFWRRTLSRRHEAPTQPFFQND